MFTKSIQFITIISHEDQLGPQNVLQTFSSVATNWKSLIFNTEGRYGTAIIVDLEGVFDAT